VRIAVLIKLSPRKLGSLEDWLIAFAAAAQRAGHALDVYGIDPIHPDVLARLRQRGGEWGTLESLTRRPLAAARALAARYDVLHLNMIGLWDRAMLVAFAAWPARLLYVDHISYYWRWFEGTVPAARARGRVGRTLLRRVDGIAGVSDYVRDRVSERLGVGAPYVRAIHNGVDLARFAPPPAARVPRVGDVHVMTVARLCEEKGVDVLVRALADPSLSRARLTVVGDGPELEPLAALSRSLGVADRTSFLGLRSDLQELLRDVDVFAHPAVWEEAFGLTVAEAMAAGCPVVATRTGATPELVADGETGVLVPPGDPGALAAAIARLADDPALRERLGRAGRRRAEARFDVARCADRHLAWCEEAARRRGPRRAAGGGGDGAAPEAPGARRVRRA
jgi:glycosyltransferase involved in cell wall biosynthesis